MKNQLHEFPVVLEIPVQWGEMDAARHINNLIYLRWGESARIQYFEEVGIPIDFNSESGPILGYQDCKYIFPVTYPDTVLVGAKVTEIRQDRFFIEIHIFSKKHQRLVAINKNSCVAYDYINLKKINVPQAWTKAMEALEGKSFSK